MFHVPNERRLRRGKLASDDSYGNNGAFLIKRRAHELACIASDGGEDGNPIRWEHVSVTVLTAERAPTWEEMCFVKEAFWDGEDVVIQLHPRRSEYVNVHGNCLHLWRAVHDDGTPLETPLPPKGFV